MTSQHLSPRSRSPQTPSPASEEDEAEGIQALLSLAKAYSPHPGGAQDAAVPTGFPAQLWSTVQLPLRPLPARSVFLPPDRDHAAQLNGHGKRSINCRGEDEEENSGNDKESTGSEDSDECAEGARKKAAVKALR